MTENTIESKNSSVRLEYFWNCTRTRLHSLADGVFQLETFNSVMSPYPDFEGLFLLHNIPRLNSLNVARKIETVSASRSRCYFEKYCSVMFFLNFKDWLLTSFFHALTRLHKTTETFYWVLSTSKHENNDSRLCLFEFLEKTIYHVRSRFVVNIFEVQ